MRKPSKAVLMALCNLDNNADFRVIKEWFLESASDQDTVLRSSESAPILYRAQGAVKELLDFCDISTDTKEKAGKMAMKQAGIRTIP
jgi:hypothetical protein